jgi:hypothetical protein
MRVLLDERQRGLGRAVDRGVRIERLPARRVGVEPGCAQVRLHEEAISDRGGERLVHDGECAGRRGIRRRCKRVPLGTANFLWRGLQQVVTILVDHHRHPRDRVVVGTELHEAAPSFLESSVDRSCDRHGYQMNGQVRVVRLSIHATGGLDDACGVRAHEGLDLCGVAPPVCFVIRPPSRESRPCGGVRGFERPDLRRAQDDFEFRADEILRTAGEEDIVDARAKVQGFRGVRTGAGQRGARRCPQLRLDRVLTECPAPFGLEPFRQVLTEDPGEERCDVVLRAGDAPGRAFQVVVKGRPCVERYLDGADGVRGRHCRPACERSEAGRQPARHASEHSRHRGLGCSPRQVV